MKLNIQKLGNGCRTNEKKSKWSRMGWNPNVYACEVSFFISQPLPAPLMVLLNNPSIGCIRLTKVSLCIGRTYKGLTLFEPECQFHNLTKWTVTQLSCKAFGCLFINFLQKINKFIEQPFIGIINSVSKCFYKSLRVLKPTLI